MHKHRFNTLTCLLITTGLFAALASTASAQTPAHTPTTFDACYAEKTGVMYRIDPGGTLGGTLPATCVKDGKHIQFNWMDGEGADHGDLTGLGDDDHAQYLPVDGSRSMTGKLTTTDKIGIGTATPGSPLTILPVDGADIEFATGTGFNADILSRNELRVGTLNTTSVHLLAGAIPRVSVNGVNGNVGIGDLSPDEKLSVAGVIESTSGGFKFPDGTVQNAGLPVASATPTDGDVLAWDEASGNWTPTPVVPTSQTTSPWEGYSVHTGTAGDYSQHIGIGGLDTISAEAFCPSGTVPIDRGFVVSPTHYGRDFVIVGILSDAQQYSSGLYGWAMRVRVLNVGPDGWGSARLIVKVTCVAL